MDWEAVAERDTLKRREAVAERDTLKRREIIEENTSSIAHQLKLVALERLTVIGSIIIDGLFLIATTGVNYFVNWCVKKLQLEGIDALFFVCLQCMIAITTLGVVSVFLTKDLISAFRRAGGRGGK